MLNKKALLDENVVEERLAGLGLVEAPAGLAATILERVRHHSDRHFVLGTPIGQVRVAVTGSMLVAVSRTDDTEGFESWVEARTGRRPVAAQEAPDVAVRLREALEGRPADLSFDLGRLGEFETAVLMKALEIPRGEVRTYKWIAAEIGRPRAVRAVGTALAHNPIPLFIPCHRVVRSDGKIGQYSAGGPAAKRAILAHEGVDVSRLGEVTAAAG